MKKHEKMFAGRELRERRVSSKLIKIFRVLSSSGTFPYVFNNEVRIGLASGAPLVHITSGAIATPVKEISDSIFDTATTLPDSFVSMEDFSKLIDYFNEENAITGLDHIGFCYPVSSQEKELERIKQCVRMTPFRLYEWRSNDFSKWYFVGDLGNWKDPVIELLPTPPNDEPELAYWMPHIHIDMNTKLSSDTIIRFLKNVFGDTKRPTLKRDRFGVYSVRLWLGAVAGVNIHLDIATTVRNVRWVRANMLRQIQ